MSLKSLFLELLFPSFCLNCQRLGPVICQNCYSDLQFYFLQNKLEIVSQNFPTIYFDQLQVMAKFNGSLNKMIKGLKYHSSRNLAQFIAQMLWQHLSIPEADLITFIPLHHDKLRRRGFNQGREIAIYLGKIARLKVRNLLEKTTNTQSQASIKNQEARINRMKNLFVIRKKYQNLIKDKKIIILDDVVTTGATLNAVSQILKNHGAKKVFGLIAASKME